MIRASLLTLAVVGAQACGLAQAMSPGPNMTPIPREWLAPICSATIEIPEAIGPDAICLAPHIVQVAQSGGLPPWPMMGPPEPPKNDSVRSNIAAACPTEFMPAPKVPATLERCDRMIASLAADSQSLADALAGKGFLQLSANSLDAAVATLDAALAIDPENRIALTWKIEARFRLGQIPEAHADVERLLALYPDDPHARRHYAQLMAMIGSPEDTLAAIDKALEVSPDQPMLHHQRAELLKNLGRGDEALAEFDLIIDLVPNAGFAFAARAEIELELGRTDDAIADIERAKQTGFMMVGLDLLLARANLMLGQLEAALTAIDAEMSDPAPAPDSVATMLPLYRFVILDQLGRKTEAQQALTPLTDGPIDGTLRIQVFLRNMGMNEVTITGHFDETTRVKLAACLKSGACGGPLARNI